MNTQLIITHPGSAHFDEVTAVSLILAVYTDLEFRIERREPYTAELDDPNVWVVDIGDRYEPEKRNFDHHQSLDCPAAFVLVAEYLGLLEDFVRNALVAFQGLRRPHWSGQSSQNIRPVMTW